MDGLFYIGKVRGIPDGLLLACTRRQNNKASTIVLLLVSWFSILGD